MRGLSRFPQAVEKAASSRETAPTKEELAHAYAPAYNTALWGRCPHVKARTGIRVRTLQSWGTAPSPIEEPGEERRQSPMEIQEAAHRALRAEGQDEAKAIAPMATYAERMGYWLLPLAVDAQAPCAVDAMAGFFGQVGKVAEAASAGMTNGCTPAEHEVLKLSIRRLIQQLVAVEKSFDAS
jgi:hypothetical protein